MTIRVIVESTADLPKELIDKHGIEVIPIQVSDGTNQFLDGITLPSDTLFSEMENGTVFKTSLPSMEKTEQIFRHFAENNISGVYTSFSSELSGTFQAAKLVLEQVKEEYPNLDLEIVDTKCASMGQGLVALEAVKLAEAGKSVAEIVEAVSTFAYHLEHIFTVDDLQYLVRGGRVSKVAGFVGGLLNIKPILNVEDGKLIPLEKVRGSKKVLPRIVEIIEERGVNLAEQTISISHGNDLGKAVELKEMMEEKFGCKDFIISSLGSAVGSHAGPGTLAVFFLNKELV